MRFVECQWWSIELPPEWEAEQDEETILIGDEDGVGEIAITTLEKQAGVVTDDELREHAQEVEDYYGLGLAINVGELEGYYYSYLEDSEAIREWYLRNGSLLILVAYSCDQSNAGMDDSVVDEILSTIALAIKSNQE